MECVGTDFSMQQTLDHQSNVERVSHRHQEGRRPPQPSLLIIRRSVRISMPCEDSCPRDDGTYAKVHSSKRRQTIPNMSALASYGFPESSSYPEVSQQRPLVGEGAFRRRSGSLVLDIPESWRLFTSSAITWPKHKVHSLQQGRLHVVDSGQVFLKGQNQPV